VKKRFCLFYWFIYLILYMVSAWCVPSWRNVDGQRDRLLVVAEMLPFWMMTVPAWTVSTIMWLRRHVLSTLRPHPIVVVGYLLAFHGRVALLGAPPPSPTTAPP
jgi:hypothetical protein